MKKKKKIYLLPSLFLLMKRKILDSLHSTAEFSHGSAEGGRRRRRRAIHRDNGRRDDGMEESVSILWLPCTKERKCGWRIIGRAYLLSSDDNDEKRIFIQILQFKNNKTSLNNPPLLFSFIVSTTTAAAAASIFNVTAKDFFYFIKKKKKSVTRARENELNQWTLTTVSSSSS